MYTKKMTFDFQDRAETFARKMNSPKRRNDPTLPEIAEVGPVQAEGGKWTVKVTFKAERHEVEGPFYSRR